MVNRHTLTLLIYSFIFITLFTGCGRGTADPVPTIISSVRDAAEPIEAEVAEIAEVDADVDVDEEAAEAKPTSALQRFVPKSNTAVPDDSESPTRTPTLTPQPTATALPTSPPPAIVVQDQVIRENGRLEIDELFVSEPAWLAVQSLGNVISVTALEAGDANNLRLTIDPFRVGDDITFTIHNRTDAPFDIENGSVLLEQTVRATFDMRFPGIFAADQFVDQDGILTIDQIDLPENGWLTVYTDVGEATDDFLVDESRLGDIVGTKFITAGTYSNVQMPIKWQEASERLNVVLHRDNGRIGRFDPVGQYDPLVTVRGAPVGLSIGVTYRPWVTVINQPVINNRITIDYARVNDPSWLAIWRDDGEGFIYTVIGFVKLEPGINRDLTISLIQGLATNKLSAQVFVDVDKDGEFDFPGIDQPRRQYGEDRLFEFQTNEGATLVASDQTIAAEQNSVMIERVVSPVNTFVAVYADDGGVPGALLGEMWTPAGINRAVSVPVNRDGVTSLVHALLYADYGTPKQFNPDTSDPLLERGGFPISSPFGIKFGE